MTEPASAPRPRWWMLPASLLILWHLTAIVLGPAPPSHVAGELYPVFKPYLRVLNLDHTWGFFSPEPSEGRRLRYAVIDAGGARREFRPYEALSRWDPSYFRFTTLYAALDADVPGHLRAAADYLCRRHAVLGPRAVVFEAVEQRRISPEMYLAGARPLDPEHLDHRELEPLPCR